MAALRYLSLVVGLALLVKGADWLVSGASALGRRLGISELAIGLTVVAFGTSLPELVVSVVASVTGRTDIAVGNILGSNTANILFVLGLASCIRPLPLSPPNNIDILVVVLATLMLFVTMFTGKRRILDRWEGWLMLAAYVGYLVYLIDAG